MNDQWERLKEVIKSNSGVLKFIERDVNDIIRLYDPENLNNYNIILQQSWRICEKITKYILYKNRIGIEVSRNLFDNIEILKNKMTIPDDVISCLHLIRIYSNKSKHAEFSVKDTIDDLYIIVETLIKILLWFSSNYTESTQNFFSGRPILIMADIPELYTKKLVTHIYKSINSDIIYLSEGHDLLSYELKSENIAAIVLLITDVTKLSENDNIRNEINDKIVNYVENGGLVVATSDVMFRRTSNEGLQLLFGCVIDNYKRHNEGQPVKYLKTDACRNLDCFNDLPDEFELSEGVVNWGNWKQGSVCLFETAEEYSGERRPLVIIKKSGKGTCLWLNGGEYRDYPPKSIALPEKPLVELIRAFIKFVNSNFLLNN